MAEQQNKRKRDSSPEIQTSKKRKLHSYTLDFKLQAIQHVKTGNSKEATARKFGVAPKQIREWCKKETELRNTAEHSKLGKRKRLDGAGRRPLSETLETELFSWIEHQRSQRLRVTRKKVKKEALRLFANSDDPENTKEFVASDGWLRNFFKRHRINPMQNWPWRKLLRLNWE